MKQTRTRRRRSRELEGPPPATGTPTTPLPSSSITHHPSSPLGRATSTQPKLNLPAPIYTPVDHTKKSHARKQPVGHIPRPRNAFILFRCNFVDQDKIPSTVERDHRNISRIVGSIWQRMSDAEKEPWVRMADDEKRAHFLAYPGYRFSRALTSIARPIATRSRRDDGTTSSRSSSSPNSHESFPQSVGNPSRLSIPSPEVGRPASCHLGVDTPAPSSDVTFPVPIINREELARRPIRVMLSESARYEDSYPEFNDMHALGGYTMRCTDDRDKYTSNGKDIHDWEGHQFNAQSNGPRLNALRMPMPDMDHPSELDSVNTWDDWHATQRQKSISPPRREPTQDALEYSSLMMAHSIDLDLSPTLPPLPMSHTPERLDDEYCYPAPASPIERKNSFYSPKSGTWKLPFPVVSFNQGTGSSSKSTSHIDYDLSFQDNMIDDEFRYPNADELSRRTRASLSWSFDSPNTSRISGPVDKCQLYRREAHDEDRDSWRSSLREAEPAAPTPPTTSLHRG